jgi:hypothetical protein
MPYFEPIFSAFIYLSTLLDFCILQPLICEQAVMEEVSLPIL